MSDLAVSAGKAAAMSETERRAANNLRSVNMLTSVLVRQHAAALSSIAAARTEAHEALRGGGTP